MKFCDVSSVDLIEHMGGDKQIVNSARVSFAREHDDGPLDDSDSGLIGFLMRHRHGTPFESCVMTFRVHTFIAVAREWMRHRIGSFNEVSARYTQLDMKFFAPAHARGQTGKPGAYKIEQRDHLTPVLREVLARVYEEAERGYEELLENGVAKEQARLVLPVATMTSFYWTVNARSLMNFLELRLAPNAMLEIREAAEIVRDHFQRVAPVTCTMFDECGKAP